MILLMNSTRLIDNSHKYDLRPLDFLTPLSVWQKLWLFVFIVVLFLLLEPYYCDVVKIVFLSVFYLKFRIV